MNKRTYMTIQDGLGSANRGNPFWSQSDAMSLLNLYRNNYRKHFGVTPRVPRNGG